jgi:hypothetical protein
VYFGGQTQMVVKMVVKPIAKLSDEVDQIRHASPGPVTASTIASVGRLHAAARLDHCGATQWTLGVTGVGPLADFAGLTATAKLGA